MAPDDLIHLEALIDKYGLDRVLSALSKICGLKAARIAVDYQDATLARRWAEFDAALDAIVTKAIRL